MKKRTVILEKTFLKPDYSNSTFTDKVDSARMVVKIDKGIPLPSLPVPREKYPWAIMEKGDSFYTPTGYYSMVMASRRAHIKYNRDYEVRAEGTGSRVWCMKVHSRKTCHTT